jgi:hypothetical protein
MAFNGVQGVSMPGVGSESSEGSLVGCVLGHCGRGSLGGRWRLAEAQSADPWTSRARPNFLYVMYILLPTALPTGVLSAFHAAAHVGNDLGARVLFKQQ